MTDIPILRPGHQGFLPKNMRYVHEWDNGMPAMVGTPAISKWLDLTGTHSTEVRATLDVRGVLYALIADSMYKITDVDTYEIVGTVSLGSGPAVIIHNGTEVMVSQLGVNSYMYTIATDTWALISGIPGFSSLTYQDGWAIGVSAGTELFYLNETAYSFATWSALDYEYADRLPDLLSAGYVLDGELWLFGKKSIEVYQNTGNSNFPWEKILGIDHSIGVGSRLGPAILDNSLFFPDNHNQVRRSAGYGTVIVSTVALETEIGKFTTIDDAVGFGIHYEGAWWYVLTYPTEGKTYIYDVTASVRLKGNVWYRWTSFPEQVRHRINTHAFFGRQNLVGDHDEAIIWKLDDSVYHDNGEELHSELTFPLMSDGGMKMPWNRLEINMKTGVGLINDLASPAAGSKPVVMISYSDDDGQTFGVETMVSIGKMGESKKRVVRRNMGQTKRHGRIVRVRITDPVERVIMGARYF